MELMQMVRCLSLLCMFLLTSGQLEPYIPFERLDLACLLYERVINKESFQLVINLFESVEDRNNLVHRLHLKRTDTGFVTNCSLLQSTVESVGTLSPRAALSGRSVDFGSSLRVAEEVVSRVRVVTPSPHTSLDPIPTTAVITEVDSSGKYAAQSELNAVKEPSDPV